MNKSYSHRSRCVGCTLLCALFACSSRRSADSESGSSDQGGALGDAGPAGGQSDAGRVDAGSSGTNTGGTNTGGTGTGGTGTGGTGTGGTGISGALSVSGAGGATNANGGAVSSAGSPGSVAGGGGGGGGGAAPLPGTTPPITPRWAFEPWVWEDNTNTRQSTETLVKDYKDHDIPVGAVIIDSPWETTFNTLSWDTTRYPAPQAMIAGFHAQGVKVVMWITAFVDTDAAQYQTVKAQNYGVNHSVSSTWWKGTGIHIDVTNPAAAAFWNARMGAVLADGIDGWKLDQGADFVGDPVLTAAGSISKTDFKKRLSADFYDYTTSQNPNGIVLVRPYAAAQGLVGSDISRCSVGWVGDHDGAFSGIATQLSDIYTSAQMGYGAPGVEVGGYVHAPSKDSLIRYAEFGALTPLMENGGENGGLTQHLPWYWDDATVSTYRYFATLHNELGSYNFSYGVEAHLTGQSIIRASDKEKAAHQLGDQLFTSVITTDVTTKSVTFPAGSNWIDYWNEDTVYAGGTTTQYSAPLSRYPLFIQAGAVIPMDVETAVTGHGDATSNGKVTLLVYPRGQRSFRFHRPLGEGTAYSDVTIEADAATGSISVTGSVPTAYRLRVKSFQAPASVTGADSWAYDATGKVVVVDKQGSAFAIVIAGLKGYP